MVARYARKSFKGTQEFIKILRRDPCVFCGEYYKLPKDHKKAGLIRNTVDHIHPKSKGGWNHWLNYAAACPRCNTHKGDNSLLGHLLGVQLPSEKNEMPVQAHPAPDFSYDPLGTFEEDFIVKIDPRFVGLGARERKVLRAKLALES